MDIYDPKTIMHKDTAGKRTLSKLNSCITCKLCKGYFVDATTIIECLHTFCRSCIVKYLESNKYCPVCDVQVHKTKPLLNIRQDKTIQDLVYKLVPRLYHNEAKRRKLFYETNTSAKPSVFEDNVVAQYDFILSPEETIDLTLNYCGCSSMPRYLRCSSAVSIAHLKKLIRAKYDLTERHKVEMFYNQEELNPSWSLMDVAYIHSWKKVRPLDLTYKIYECRAKKPKLEGADIENSTSNINNWKEVQLRISENGEMSITGIQDALDLLEATESYKSEVVINESKSSENVSENSSKEVEVKPLLDEVKENEQNRLKEATTVTSSAETVTSEAVSSTKSLPAAFSTSVVESHSSLPFTITVNSTARMSVAQKVTASLPRCMELSETLNLNSELSVIPLNVNANCVSLSSCGGTTTVFSTINKSMCSTKSEESCTRGPPPKLPTDVNKEPTLNTVLKQSNSLKRKVEDSEKPTAEVPPKLPKPTILNHSINIMGLSNNHPLKKHSSKMSRNGERRHLEIGEKVPNLTVSPVTVAQRSSGENVVTSKPIIINRNLNYLHQLQKSKFQKNNNSGNVPCYMPKERNGEKEENHEKAEKPSTNVSKPSSHPYQNHHSSIITPSQLPHHQNMNALLRTERETNSQTTVSLPSIESKTVKPSSEGSPKPAIDPSITLKSKPSTPIGYKTLRDPPKSWNSQINSQIAKVNQTTKMANIAAGAAAAAQARLGGDLKSVRPPKFFKGRNMPRYLGNPASGVKPMYQVHVSPEKDKGQEQSAKGKSEKSEIKKHSIVKIDPKTLRPISEKAPETTSLSNMSVPQANPELRLNSTGSDLKINISSVSIFNPLKLQQSSPKSDRRSPKSPHSPKVRVSPNGSATVSTASSTSSLTPPSLNALSPKQQRDKISLTTPPNPYIPNLTSPTLNPNQFLYPAGGFPSYDPRFMAACHSLWYSQRMAAAAAAGLVPPPLPHAFGLNIGLNPGGSMGQQPSSPGVSPKHSSSPKLNNHTASKPNGPQSPQLPKAAKKSKDASSGSKNEKSLVTALEKLSQSKAKEASSGKLDSVKEIKCKEKQQVVQKPQKIDEISEEERKSSSVEKVESVEAVKESSRVDSKQLQISHVTQQLVEEKSEKEPTVCSNNHLLAVDKPPSLPDKKTEVVDPPEEKSSSEPVQPTPQVEECDKISCEVSLTKEDAITANNIENKSVNCVASPIKDSTNEVVSPENSEQSKIISESIVEEIKEKTSNSVGSVCATNVTLSSESETVKENSEKNNDEDAFDKRVTEAEVVLTEVPALTEPLTVAVATNKPSVETETAIA